MLNREQLRIAVRIFNKLNSGSIAWPSSGICSHIQRQCPSPTTASEINGWMKEQYSEWPEYSGDVHYPVPAFKANQSAEDAYTAGVTTRWDGEYGDSRRRLVKFLLERARAELKERYA